MNTESFKVKSSPAISLKHCMTKIEGNHGGFVIVVDEQDCVMGVLTDGDIRRALLAGATLESSPLSYLNRNFVSVDVGVSREHILKLLDSNIRFIPILRDRKLQDVVTLMDLQYHEKGSVTTRAKAPARISFGGGGTDLTPFFLEFGGAVLNATINLYSHATLRKLPDSTRIEIRSKDYGLTVVANDISELKYDGQLDLVKAAIKLLSPEYGFQLEISSDFPPSSGLGGSSVVLAAVIGCLNELRRDRLTSYDIAELSFQAERIELKCSGGWQDQYASVFGGVNFMEFRKDRNEINALRVSPEIFCELEQRLLLCYTGKAHPTNKIHDNQKKKMVEDHRVLEFSKKTRDTAYEMKSELLRGHVGRLGELLHSAWLLKRSLSEGIATPEIDDLYDYAKAHGAAGGKILGAGGGGYFLFQSHRDSRSELREALAAKGLQVQNIMFDHQGLRSWVVRD